MVMTETRTVPHSQLAFIVDHYLCANNFFQTSATFRMEASSLFAASQTLPNASLYLGQILDDYVSLKRKNLILDQERLKLMQEKSRVQKLLQDLQNAVNAYNAFQRPIPVNIASGMYSAPTASAQNANMQSQQRPPLTANICANKRKERETMHEPVAKRPRGRPPAKKNQVRGPDEFPKPRTQSVVANSASTQSEVPTNSSHLGTSLPCFHLYTPGSSSSDVAPVTTCNGEVGVIPTKRVMDDPPKQITSKESLRISPLNSDADKKNNKENASLTFETLEDSAPNEVSRPNNESENDRSHVDLSHIDFSDSGMEYWSGLNFSNFETEILDEDFFDLPASTHSWGDA